MSKHLKELLMENYQTIGVTYNGQLNEGSGDLKRYTFKAPKNMRLIVGDKVVITGGDGVSMKVGTVEELHEIPQIDFDAQYSYKWIIAALDLEQYNELVAFDANFDSTMVQVEREQKRQELLDAYNEKLPKDSKARGMLDALLGGLNRLTSSKE